MAYIGPFSLIIPTGVKTNGSDVFNILDPDSGGAATFSVPLSLTGLAPVTHWGAHTHLEENAHNALTTMSITAFKAYVDAQGVALGRTPVGSVTAFKNALLIGAGGSIAAFNAFIAASSLQRVPPAI